MKQSLLWRNSQIIGKSKKSGKKQMQEVRSTCTTGLSAAIDESRARWRPEGSLWPPPGRGLLGEPETLTKTLPEETKKKLAQRPGGIWQPALWRLWWEVGDEGGRNVGSILFAADYKDRYHQFKHKRNLLKHIGWDDHIFSRHIWEGKGAILNYAWRQLYKTHTWSC